MKKIIVIGCPGAGKSTFARSLAKKTGLPLHYLDSLWYKPDKTNISREEFDAKLEKITDGECWIIDGNYKRTIPKRLEKCDTVCLLDYPLDVCLSGAAARIGTVREDLPWVEEEFDEEFKSFIIDFPKKSLPDIYRMLSETNGKDIHIFKSRDEAELFLKSI